jgi:NNP family nitrate/nitrite transporter-like MFS transporter
VSAPLPRETAVAAPTPTRRALSRWDVEDRDFWAAAGARVARRNLLVSIPCLLSAFAVWQCWSVIVVQMQRVGFPFTKAQHYAVLAVAGLSGATLRIPSSFLVALSGGRLAVAATTALLLLPVVGASVALRDPSTPFATFVVLAALSGIGGGAFASSMSNITPFFPKREQGLALGLNAGIGNLGVSVVQLLLPLATTVALFGPLGGDPLHVQESAGGVEAGTPRWLQNAGLVWIPVLAVLAVLAWRKMDDLPDRERPGTAVSLGRIAWLHALGFLGAAAGLWIFLVLGASIWVALPAAVLVTLAAVRWMSPAGTRARLAAQLRVLRDRDTWVMTWLYVMTFGSFIGYAAAFPKLIQDVFGRLPSGAPNLAAPNPLTYAWLGPLVGSVARPWGGRLSDRFGGARVTHWTTLVLIAAAVGVGAVVTAARGADSPETWFFPFLGLMLVLFVATGVGNGSTFRMVPMLFEPAKAGPVLGWTSAVAAYGGFVVPSVFGSRIEAGRPEAALYGFAAYYVSCLAVNWWFYARRGAGARC